MIAALYLINTLSLALLGFALPVALVVYLISTRRRAAKVQSLVEKLSREVEQHRESEERYRSLIENAPDAIISLDIEGRLASANPFCSTFTGLSSETCLGQPFWTLIHKDDLPKVRAAFTTALRGEKPPMIEIRVSDKSGDFIPLEFTVTPQLHGPQVCGVLAIGRDVSARNEAERAQAALAAQLRHAQKMESLGRLAGGIAHDFNNFLTVIMSNCELVGANIDPNHPAAKNLEQINKACQHAAELVRQILTFSRQREQERSVLNLTPVVEEAITMLRSTLSAAIDIQAQLSPDCPPVLADAGQIHQVILNLANNSAHAMSEKGGRIEVLLKPVMVGEEFAARNPDLHPGIYARLIVSDNGHGMDSATLEHIFEPFFTTKAAKEGTGLGLSVVHGIVKSHDGAITVYSEMGRGTSFHLYFPAARTGGIPEKKSQAPAVRQGNDRHILFVDDECDLVKCGQRVLEHLGYRVTTAANANEALAAISNTPEKFDCLVTDLSMPGMSGIDLARSCQRLLPGIPIILMSGYSNETDTGFLRSHGIHELVLKPFTLQTLADALQRALADGKDVTHFDQVPIES